MPVGRHLQAGVRASYRIRAARPAPGAVRDGRPRRRILRAHHAPRGLASPRRRVWPPRLDPDRTALRPAACRAARRGRRRVSTNPLTHRSDAPREGQPRSAPRSSGPSTAAPGRAWGRARPRRPARRRLEGAGRRLSCCDAAPCGIRRGAPDEPLATPRTTGRVTDGARRSPARRAARRRQDDTQRTGVMRALRLPPPIGSRRRAGARPASAAPPPRGRGRRS